MGQAINFQFSKFFYEMFNIDSLDLPMSGTHETLPKLLNDILIIHVNTAYSAKVLARQWPLFWHKVSK